MTIFLRIRHGKITKISMSVYGRIYGQYWEKKYQNELLLAQDLKSKKLTKQDDGGVGGHGVHFSPWMHQEYTLRQQNCMQNTS